MPEDRPRPAATWLAVGLTTAAVLAGGAWLVRAMMTASPGPLSAHTGDGRARGGVRSHAELEQRCAACHPVDDDARTVSALCLDCHDEIELQLRDPKALHSRLGPQVKDDCIACHTEHAGRDAEITHVDPAGFPHEAVGFALTAHRKSRSGAPFQCEDCHTGAAEGAARAAGQARYAALGCAECHLKDKPDLMKAHVAAFGEGCTGCHDGVDRFAHGAFDHTRTGFALEGRHAALGCEQCHVQVRDRAGFGTADPACATCHKPPPGHARQGYPATCGDCHGTTDWGAADARNHRFPIAHGSGTPSPCATCHPKSYKEYTCFNCHAHEPGAMLRLHRHETRVRGLDEIRDCVRCHQDGGEHDGHREGDHGDFDERSDE